MKKKVKGDQKSDALFSKSFVFATEISSEIFIKNRHSVWILWTFESQLHKGGINH